MDTPGVTTCATVASLTPFGGEIGPNPGGCCRRRETAHRWRTTRAWNHKMPYDAHHLNRGCASNALAPCPSRAPLGAPDVRRRRCSRPGVPCPASGCVAGRCDGRYDRGRRHERPRFHRSITPAKLCAVQARTLESSGVPIPYRARCELHPTTALRAGARPKYRRCFRRLRSPSFKFRSTVSVHRGRSTRRHAPADITTVDSRSP